VFIEVKDDEGGGDKFSSGQFSSPRLTWCWVLKHFSTTTQ